MRIVISPAIKAVAAATMAIEPPTLAPMTSPAASSFGMPLSSIPFLSAAVPMMRGLRAMM